MASPFIKRIFYGFFHEPSQVYWREAPFVRHLKPYLPAQGQLIDIGCASGKMAEYIQKQTGLDITLLDVVDHNESHLPLQTYDGHKIPFKTNQFDVSLLVFVLHHATDPIQLLAETRRITRQRLIVIEDTPRGRWERAAWRRWDYLLNTGYHADIHEAHTAHSADKWQEIFAAAGFKVEAQKSFRSFIPVLGMYHHTLFVLEKV